MCKSGLTAGARIIAPYYCLLLPLWLLLSNSGQAVRTWWWRMLAWTSYGFAFVAVLLTARPPGAAGARHCWAGLEQRPADAVAAPRHGGLFGLPAARGYPGAHAGCHARGCPGGGFRHPVYSGNLPVAAVRGTPRGPSGQYHVAWRICAGRASNMWWWTPNLRKRCWAGTLADWQRAMNAVQVTNMPIRVLASRGAL